MNIEYLNTILVEVNALTGIIDRSDGYVSLPCPDHHDYKALPTKTTLNSGEIILHVSHFIKYVTQVFTFSLLTECD